MALNNLQWLICHKTKPNQTEPNRTEPTSQSPKEFYGSNSLGQSLVCAYTFCQHGQVLITCTIPSRSYSAPSHVYSCIPFVLVSCIFLLYNQPFRIIIIIIIIFIIIIDCMFSWLFLFFCLLFTKLCFISHTDLRLLTVPVVTKW